MSTALRRAAVILTWIVTWGGIGWVVGYRDHGHAWQAVPLLGALYGLAAGTVFAVLHSSPLARRRPRLTRATGLGVLASIAAIPPVWFIIGGLPPVLLAFFPIAGALTGAATAWIAAREHPASVIAAR